MRSGKTAGMDVARGRHGFGNYLKKLAEAWRHNPPKPGGVRHVMVVHDDWCSLLAGRGPCDCDPDVKILGREQ